MVFQLSSLEIKDQAHITAGYKTQEDRRAADVRTAAYGELLYPSAELQQPKGPWDARGLQIIISSHTSVNPIMKSPMT